VATPAALFAGGVAGFIGVAVLFYFTSAHFQAATSDSATIVLEGQAVAGGHVLLHGWDLTFASYWTSNALIDAAAVGLGGLRTAVLYAGPAVAGALVVLAGAVLAREGRRGAAGMAGVVAVVALLCFGVPAMEYFFVGHGFHVGTIAYVLLAFAALRRPRPGWGRAVAVVALAAGILGDLLTVAYGVVPLLLAGAVVARGERRPWARTGEVTAAVAGVVVAGVARLVSMALGAYTAGSGLSFAFPAQMLTNLGHVPAYAGGLLGLGNAVTTSGGVPGQLGAMHDLGAVDAVAALVVLACFLAGLARLSTGLVTGRRGAAPDAEVRALGRLDDVLVIAIVCSVAPFVLLAEPRGAGIRYLTATVVFAAVLSGRMIGRAWQGLGRGWGPRALAPAGAALSLALVASFGYGVSGPRPPDPVPALTSWLEAHDLHEGIGDYWAASITTVESGGKVTVRPVSSDDGRVERRQSLSCASWYAGRRFQFLVYAGNGYQVGMRVAERTWGKPEHVYVVGRYRVLVWRHTLRLS